MKEVSCSFCPAKMLRQAQRRVNRCSDCTAAWERDWEARHPGDAALRRARFRARHPERARRQDMHACRRYRKRQKLLAQEVDTAAACSCGLSHSPESRLSILRRAEGLSPPEIHDAWPCIWPAVTAGERMLYRDLAEVRGRKGA